jgi:hypothetical protein
LPSGANFGPKSQNGELMGAPAFFSGDQAPAENGATSGVVHFASTSRETQIVQ